MRIAFFISNHGFGHVMRNLPVAEELINRGYQVVIVTGRSQGEVADQYLKGKAEIIICDTDAGLIVRPGSLVIDQEATTERVRSHLDMWPEMIKDAPDADVYVIDIVPWALLAAKKKNIPLFFMASFTWIDQYNPFLPKQLLDRYYEAFSEVDRVLYYELVNKPTRNLFGNGKNVGFVARPFNPDKVVEIRKQHKRKIVFLSLGASNTGLDFDIDVGNLPYDFISTKALHLIGQNVKYLDISVENTQDYIKAADFCIAKAGWSTISEIMLAGTPVAFLERDDSPEDMMNIEELKSRNAAISIKAESLINMASVLSEMESFDWKHKKYKNSFKMIADIICRG